MRTIGLSLILLFYLEPAQCASYKFIKMECNPEPKYIVNATCKLKAINRYKAVANMDCDVVDIIRNVSLHMQAFKKDYTNQYKPFLVNLTVNVCDVLSRNGFVIYTRVIWNILKEVSNVNHSCPYRGHFFTRNLYVDQKYLPVTPPLGTYKTVFRFMEGYPYNELGTVVFYVEVTEMLSVNKVC